MIGGLPCSGKTTLAYSLTNIVVDDIFSLDQLPNTRESFSITDVNFCNKKIVDQCKDYITVHYPTHNIIEIYFENDVDKCLNNMIHRNDGRKVEKAIQVYSKFYNPPSDALPIWQPKDNVYESPITETSTKR